MTCKHEFVTQYKEGPCVSRPLRGTLQRSVIEMTAFPLGHPLRQDLAPDSLRKARCFEAMSVRTP